MVLIFSELESDPGGFGIALAMPPGKYSSGLFALVVDI
jgi:hypothetical protein